MPTPAAPAHLTPGPGPSRYAGFPWASTRFCERSKAAIRRTDLPDLRSGDSVRVHTLIKEGDKERVQIFEGVVIGQHRGGSRASFTVRKVSYGVGVERIFPLHTSRIEKIEVVSRGEVRRARLNYLRELGQGRPHQGREAAATTAPAEQARRAPRGSPPAAPAAGRAAKPPRSRARPRPCGSASRRAQGLGRRAESLAAAHPRVGRACASSRATGGRPEGELDIVADDDGTCVFVEVRSRTGEERAIPLEAITPHKRARVIRAARLYLDAEAPAADGYRFDVVAVTFWDDGRQPDVVHIPNAFEVGG